MKNLVRKLILPALMSSLVPVSMTYAAGLQMEEVIVTATKRAESIQDVPIAISAFTSNELEASGIGSIEDLQNMTPGLSVSRQAAGINTFIRGIGASDTSAGQEAAVATYVDGVYIPSGYGALFAFSNIERIEVLKGPQGTLFGRNATGGLLNIITKDPSEEPAFDASLSFGNYDTVEAKVYGSIGLTENLVANTSVIYRDQGKGWAKVLILGATSASKETTLVCAGKCCIPPRKIPGSRSATNILQLTMRIQVWAEICCLVQ
jgi:iron complex outermembrane receptor protein